MAEEQTSPEHVKSTFIFVDFGKRWSVNLSWAQCSKVNKNHKVGLHRLFLVKITKNDEETTPLLHFNSYWSEYFYFSDIFGQF